MWIEIIAIALGGGSLVVGVISLRITCVSQTRLAQVNRSLSAQLSTIHATNRSIFDRAKKDSHDPTVRLEKIATLANQQHREIVALFESTGFKDLGIENLDLSKASTPSW